MLQHIYIMWFLPTLSGVFSSSHRLEGKAVVPVQQITWVTPYKETQIITIHSIGWMKWWITNYAMEKHFEGPTSNIDGSKSSCFLVSPLKTYHIQELYRTRKIYWERIKSNWARKLFLKIYLQSLLILFTKQCLSFLKIPKYHPWLNIPLKQWR